MPNIVAALLLVSGGALHLGSEIGSPDSHKCAQRAGGDPGMPETVLIIDHKPFDGDPSEWNYTDYDIYWVEIVCWRWIEEHFGIQVRNGATYVLTEEWAERTRKGQIASLEALIAAQDNHRQARGAYARQLDNLSGFGALSDHDLPEYFRVELAETDEGWGARVEGTEKWLAGFGGSVPAPPCYAFVGTPPDAWKAIEDEDRAALIERQPVCIEP
ncbi:hypothetical protein [Candidatus Palauibacter sp.]|uniref:hypothetical protein n=1 Tax=Candidatus Palauibacter sp. TaxID=3101350 RepID=UPI003AF31899